MASRSLRVTLSAAVLLIASAGTGAVWWLGRALSPSPATLFWIAASAILAATLLIDQVVMRLVYRRLAKLRVAIHRAAAGQLDARAAVGSLDEIGTVARGVNEILDGLQRVAVADSHREMSSLSEELARAGRLAALGQAAANMAHQLGTPLNLISNYAQLLIQATPPEGDAVVRLKAIQDQVTRMTAVIRAALESSRASAIPHERADLVTLVRRVCQMASPMVQSAGVTIELVLPDTPLPILAEPVQLELALLNLVTNSVDATPAGGVVSVRLERGAGRLSLEIADTGSGVPVELVERIFDPWVTTKPAGKGSGLGLSIARQVVAAHGGTITVRNRASGGAAFMIDLPAAPMSQSPAASLSPSAS